MTARSAPRSLYAGGVLAVLVAVLLGAWFLSGWHDVRMRQREANQAPIAAATQRAGDLSRELRAELEALMAREVRRPYLHYQNLIHDPQASAAPSVSPSPLARGSEDKLVLGYFQLDARSRATTPTINDDVPELSEPEHLADNRVFRDRVTRDLSRDLTPVVPLNAAREARVDEKSPPSSARVRPRPEPAAPSAQASATQAPSLQQGRTSQTVALPDGGLSQTAALPGERSQVVEVDRSVYAQNANPTAVYSRQAQSAKMALGILPAPPLLPAQETFTPPTPVTITISPLEWRTMPFAGEPALLAIRQVQTPDGAFTQGFVVNRSALTGWLATRAGDMVVDLHPDESRGAAIAPGWALTIEPSPGTLAQSANEAGSVARAFLVRFIAIGSIAVMAAGFVVLLVTRAETLARERSQFAAAAAHELRTPLAGLQLYGDMLAEGLGDPGKTRDYARRMSEEAARLGRVVSNMLGFTQLERGNLSVDVQAAPLSEALCELAERAQSALNRAGATLELDIAPNLRARFDRDALARIVGNLLDNAEKYARDAADRAIRLSAFDSGNVIEVRVEDRGPGIEDRTTLFRAFSRGPSRSDGPAGLGLGLALSISLARAMGGELAYKPRDGGGATFLLQLPPA